MKYTIAEALNEMRQLHGADAGRLRGVEVPYHLDHLTGLDTMPAPWGARLVELIEARKADIITADTPHYVVYSHDLPVAWVTVHAAVITPDLPMSPIQAKHQRQAAAVLADLNRDTLRKLADERDQREGRPGTGEADSEHTMPDALRVAPTADPTRTRWVRVGADLDAARTEVARPVSLSTVGNWIDDPYGLAGHVDPQTLPRQFAACYIGRFGSHTSYLQHRMDQQGWTDLLRTSGMQPYFDRRRYEMHLFAHEVTAIDVDGWRPGLGIEVFHRRPTT